jgi:hypothetical protein
MAIIIYVSKQRGKDNYDGLTPETAVYTIGKGLTLLDERTQDMICYVGPGIYREILNWPANVPNASKVHLLCGDPEAKYVIGDYPGIVRLTGEDEDGNLNNNDIFNAQINNTHIENILVDGSSGQYTYAVERGSATFANNQICRNVVAQGGRGRGTYKGYWYDSHITAGYIAGMYGNYEKCTFEAGRYGCWLVENNSTSAIQCVAQSGQMAFRYGVLINCLGHSSSYGVYNAGLVYNSVFLNNYYGIYGDGDSEAYNCFVQHAYRSIYDVGVSTGSKIASVYYAAPAGTYTTAEWEEVKPIRFDYNKCKDIINFWNLNKYQNLDDIAVMGSEIDSGIASDIIGSTRLAVDNSLAAGPYALSLTETTFESEEYYENPPGIIIKQQGTKTFTIPAASGDTIYASVWCKYFNTDNGEEPLLKLNGKWITETEEQADLTSDWTKISVSAEVQADDLLTLTLETTMPDLSSSAYFSDIRIV